MTSMTAIPAADRRHVRGDVARKLNNALTMQFRAGPDITVATALQSGADGVGAKAGILFGFRNGGPGTHVLTSADGAELRITSRADDSTLIGGSDGTVLVEVRRGDTSVATLADGTEVFSVVPAPDGDRTVEAFRTVLLDPPGTRLARLDVIRSSAGWSLGRELADQIEWFGRAGQGLKLPVHGTALAFDRDPSDLEFDTALAVCVDMAIGLRPYIAAMA
ncbi:MAG: hypothetical protein U0Q22_12755 [Acidimicrobiales bacterium]